MKNLGQRGYRWLVSAIGSLIEQGRQKAAAEVNITIVRTYWEIGRHIVEYEQEGKERAGYSEALIVKLADDLTASFGNALSKRNLWHMRRFYLAYPKVNALRSQLNWTQYRRLISLDDTIKRRFYEIACASNRWASRELDRQINSLLFERVALSKDKIAVLECAKGEIAKPEEQIKDPYVLEFLNLKEEKSYAESDIEQAMIDHLQEFLMELGKGFSFVARQKRISINNEHYYVDLVFYNRILKCLVLIDVKKGKFTHADAGQMNFYLNYFRENEMIEGENTPIGLVLCSEKDNAFVNYALGNITNKIFASKYKLGLPSEEELRKVVNDARKMLE